ncbi:MAG: baseplate J/gp47 family protein [Candidatus Eremiobacteraeota bacterium]|nr:baseplate J/gp47 family protein [Candidatus Eremiobacteraeota bacterium]
MTSETAALIERPYQEVVDDILTAVVGGVVNEQIFFDVKETLYKLSQPATGVRTVVGQRHVTANGATSVVRYTFQPDTDYVFSAGDNAVVWQTGGAQPDDETTFFVDYIRTDSLSPLTDINVGSVTRTLSEAIGREITTVYQQIELAYLSGFVDTATGESLDFVVSILGVTRMTAELAAGLVTFFRDPAVPDGTITVPQGTQLSTTKGDATFLTAEERTLQRGQARMDIPVRATDASKGPAGIVAAGAITTLAGSISGIARVTNFDATVLGAKDESDDQLRARAKAVLQSIGKGTIAALTQAVFEEHATLVEIRDPASAPEKRSDPGTVFLLVDTPPERFVSLEGAVNEVRAAGVLATLVARYVFIKPRLVATIAPGLSPAGKIKLTGQIVDAIQGYVDTLAAGAPAVGADLIAAITKNVVELSDPSKLKVVDVMAWQADVGNPKVDPLLEALIAAVQATAPGDAAALRAALAGVLSSTSPPVFGGDRIPDRDLVQGPSGARATDVEIEAGKWSVVAVVNGDANWTIALDLEPTDIVLVEG